MSNRVRGILSLVLACVMLVVLVLAWDYLGTYTVTLRFLNTPLLGGRLVIGLGALFSFLYGLNYLGVIHWFDD